MNTFFSDAKSQTTEAKEKQNNRKSNCLSTRDKIPIGNKRTTEISTAKVEGRHSFQSIQLK